MRNVVEVDIKPNEKNLLSFHRYLKWKRLNKKGNETKKQNKDQVQVETKTKTKRVSVMYQ